MTDDDVRLHLLHALLAGGVAPSVGDTGAALGVSESDFALTGQVLIDVLNEFEVPADIIETVEGALDTVQPFVVAA